MNKKYFVMFVRFDQQGDEKTERYLKFYLPFITVLVCKSFPQMLKVLGRNL
jgi:hypothetical protein